MKKLKVGNGNFVLDIIFSSFSFTEFILIYNFCITKIYVKKNNRQVCVTNQDMQYIFESKNSWIRYYLILKLYLRQNKTYIKMWLISQKLSNITNVGFSLPQCTEHKDSLLFVNFD